MATKTILIIDDDLQLARLLEVEFAAAGYRTIVAKDGAAAFVELELAPPDLILADVFMPIIDGITFCRMVRVHPDTRDTPIIMMSGTTRPDQVMSVPIAGFLAKPFDMDVLLNLVEALIGVSARDRGGRE